MGPGNEAVVLDSSPVHGKLLPPTYSVCISMVHDGILFSGFMNFHSSLHLRRFSIAHCSDALTALCDSVSGWVTIYSSEESNIFNTDSFVTTQ